MMRNDPKTFRLVAKSLTVSFSTFDSRNPTQLPTKKEKLFKVKNKRNTWKIKLLPFLRWAMKVMMAMKAMKAMMAMLGNKRSKVRNEAESQQCPKQAL